MPVATTVARSANECLKPGIGNWLLNKLLKQTFFWGKKYFFLKFHYIFHYKNFIKSLIFKIFFFLPVLPCVDIFHAGTAWVAASVLTTFCGIYLVYSIFCGKSKYVERVVALWKMYWFLPIAINIIIFFSNLSHRK